PDKIKAYKHTPVKSYIHKEINYIKEQIDKTRSGRKRLLTLVSISEDDDLDIEEIKEKMRERQQQEKQLESKLDKLKQRVFNEEKIQKTENSLYKLNKYYMTLKGTHKNIEDKQKILRIILQEVEVIDSHTITLSTF